MQGKTNYKIFDRTNNLKIDEVCSLFSLRSLFTINQTNEAKSSLVKGMQVMSKISLHLMIPLLLAKRKSIMDKHVFRYSILWLIQLYICIYVMDTVS